LKPLMSRDFTESSEPFSVFQQWLDEATASEPNDPNAMALATVDASGMPDVRMVLLKGFDTEGFVFYTNSESAKGTEMAANMKAAVVFHWKSLRRQVRVRGTVSQVSDAESDAYYHSRPRMSQIGAWASQQSRPLENRLALETAVAKYTAKFGLSEIPRPNYWNGYRIKPEQVEFWHDRPFRLHERIVFARTQNGWSKQRIYP